MNATIPKTQSNDTRLQRKKPVLRFPQIPVQINGANTTHYVLNAACLLSATIFMSAPAMAQDDTATFPATNLEKPLQVAQPRWEGTFNFGYVGSTTARFKGADFGKSGAFNANLEAGTRLALNDQWFLNLGLASENFFFDQVSGTPMPDAVHTLRINTGLGYRLNEHWTITGLLSPALYRFDDVGANDVGISGGVLVTYQPKPSLTWSLGLMAAPDSDIPVAPIAGVRWLINDHYTLELGLPKTRVSYRIDPQWSVYAGADLNGTTFRASDSLGTKIGQPQFNNALATYRDVRLGAGTSYVITHGLRAELETGYSVYREVNYTRINESVRFQPAPYVRLGLSVRF
ncbi:MAG: hypothetical protein JWR26_3558 [Pedosphaera sp.]|nr:hypothetical protein [Pedosphaera sp.]